jgi:hypothetical protein
LGARTIKRALANNNHGSEQLEKNIPEKKLLLQLTWVDPPPELVAEALAVVGVD